MNCPNCNTPNPDEARFCASCGKATSATEPVSASHPGHHAQMVNTPSPIGKEIAGRYRIQSILGEGGMGAVYKAEQISLKRTCAVKLLRPEVAGTAIMLRRFNAEAEAVAKLSHPNTVNIYDFGQDTDGTFFIAMEFIEGKSLREAIHTDAPFPLRRALSIAAQVSASLVDAHGHSIIHRDLKPDNVMLQSRGRSRDVARVLDFGIAKLRDEGRAQQAAMTQAGDMLGTPQYMAPEQIRAEQIDGRTDVYALGCLLYEMVTARLPFEGPTIMALLSKHLMENPPIPSQRRPELGIPPAIDELIMTAIAKDPNARPQTMEIFGEQINALLAALPADPNASAQQSAVHGVPGVGATLAAGAPSHGGATPPAGFAPQTPPPMGYAPNTPPPMGYAPTPPPMQGYPSAAPQHTPPQVQSPYQQPGYPAQPYTGQQGPPMQQLQASSGGGSKLLLIIIAALVLVGGGVGIFFATRSSTPAKPDEVVTPGSDKGSDGSDSATDGSDDDDDDGDDETPADPTKPDVWGGGSTGGTTGPGASVIVAKLEAVKASMCRCRDQACADKVNAEMTEWATALAKNSATFTDPALAKRAGEIMKGYSECMMKIVTAAAEAPPPEPKVDITTQIERFADRACRCNNEACAKKVVDDLLAFARSTSNLAGADEDRATAAGRRMGACLVQAGMDANELMTAMQQLGGS